MLKIVRQPLVSPAQAPFARHWSTLRVREELLKTFDWSSVVVTTEVVNSDFVAILKELKAESVPMSWNSMALSLDEEGVTELIRIENSKRPTAIYCYYGMKENGTRQLLGCAALSDRICHGFVHEGFPVIARCYIRKEFRHQGLYSLIAAHRINLCFELWGDDLKAIHFGTSQNALSHFYHGRAFRGRMFLPIGSETLHSVVPAIIVTDYLYFTEKFSRNLVQGCNWREGKTPPSVKSLQEHLVKLTTVGFGERDYGIMRELIQTIENEIGANPFIFNKALKQFIDFAEAVPLLVNSEPTIKLETQEKKRVA